MVITTTSSSQFGTYQEQDQSKKGIHAVDKVYLAFLQFILHDLVLATTDTTTTTTTTTISEEEEGEEGEEGDEVLDFISARRQARHSQAKTVVKTTTSGSSNTSIRRTSNSTGMDEDLDEKDEDGGVDLGSVAFPVFGTMLPRRESRIHPKKPCCSDDCNPRSEIGGGRISGICITMLNVVLSFEF
ncbi:hypothetical protein DL98DRAFT_528639 [Cadophora sp. DSE1049]|nr:hypothetical protein DL98DRAFT_528639 [Cadophora sp. DSE1049]